MAKETYGGDDDSSGAAQGEVQKPKLSRFELSPDVNIRDLFWKIMASYDEIKESGIDAKQLHKDRFLFIKIALSVLESRSSQAYGMKPQLLIKYLAMLFMDNGWEDAMQQLLVELKAGGENTVDPLINALRQLLKTEKYKLAIISALRTIIRDQEAYPIALFYINEIKSKEISAELKKELSIFARGDSEENQMNAISALSMLSNDEEAAKIMVSLLSHWDGSTRQLAAEQLGKMKLSDELIESIKTKAAAETDEETKKTLERIVLKWKK